MGPGRHLALRPPAGRWRCAEPTCSSRIKGHVWQIARLPRFLGAVAGAWVVPAARGRGPAGPASLPGDSVGPAPPVASMQGARHPTDCLLQQRGGGGRSQAPGTHSDSTGGRASGALCRERGAEGVPERRRARVRPQENGHRTPHPVCGALSPVSVLPAAVCPPATPTSHGANLPTIVPLDAAQHMRPSLAATSCAAGEVQAGVVRSGVVRGGTGCEGRCGGRGEGLRGRLHTAPLWRRSRRLRQVLRGRHRPWGCMRLLSTGAGQCGWRSAGACAAEARAAGNAAAGAGAHLLADGVQR